MKVFGFAGWSGSGKTTLIEQLVPRFTRAGLVVSLVKHAHHGFDVDQPGKDSYRHREAGCKEVMVSSEKRWVLQHELRGDPEPALDQQIERMSPCDLLLIEGYKRYPMPKLEVYREANGKPLLHPEDPTSSRSLPTCRSRRSCRGSTSTSTIGSRRSSSPTPS